MSQPSSGKVATRERILAAAEDVVLTDGVVCLTLEKAAHRAGLSKGGVLYHFPSRVALISALVKRLAERFDESLRSHHQVGSFTQAYVNESFTTPQGPQEQRSEQLGAAVLAAMATEPELLAPLREAYARWQAELEVDAHDRVRTTIIRLAADGLWMCELFGLAPPDPKLREAVRQELLRMAK